MTRTKWRPTRKLHENDADYHDTIFKAFRAMADAAEPEVVEVLGYLAGTYTFGSKRPDSFFRGLGRLLCDLETDELPRLRLLLRSVLMAWTVHEWDEEDVDVILTTKVTEPPGRFEFSEQLMVVIGAGRKDGHPVPTPKDGQRLFHLLKQNGFGRGMTVQSTPGTRDAHSDTPIGDRHINMAADVAARLLEIIESAVAAPAIITVSLLCTRMRPQS